jgi:anti-anti-sigma regulatory factor
MAAGEPLVLHDDGVLRITRTAGPGLALAGEIDEDTYGALASALASAAHGAAELPLDLAAVHYCDLAGLRAMVALASTRRRVVLRGLPPGLYTVLEVLGWDTAPGLIIEPPAGG